MRLTVGATIIILVSGHALAAQSDFEVTASNGVAISKGTTYARGDAIVLPDRSGLSLLDRTGKSVSLRTCVGPYSGPIGNCPGLPANCSLGQFVAGACNNPSELGAALGLRRKPSSN